MNDSERGDMIEQGGGEGQWSSPPAAEKADGPRRLFRSRDDRVLGGVAGGLGRYFGVDPIFFRIGFAALAFFGGAGFFLYLAGWIFVPAEGEAGRPLDQRQRSRVLVLAGAFALAVAALGAVGAIGDWGWGWGWWFGGFLGPLAVIAIVGALLWAALRDRRREGAGVDPAWVAGRIALVIAVLAGATVLVIGSLVVAAAGGGAAVAALVVAIGALLVVAAFRGGARWLIVPAVLLAFPVGIVSAADIDLDGGIGEREYQPSSTADLRSAYELGMGRLEVDLRDAELPRGDRPLKVDLGVGEAVVIVPEDVCVALDSRVGAGYARLFDRDSGGLDVDWDSSPEVAPTARRLILDADVGVGALHVVHDPSDVEHREWRDGDSIADSVGNVGCERRVAP
jgi:phage shock protein PspC (stress-responsive transcriptional regulator)/predicted membrane protein